MTITVTIPTLPVPPQRSDPTNFAERADEFLGILPSFGTALGTYSAEANALAASVNAALVDANAAANAAASSANTTAWVSGGPVTSGDTVWSLIDFKSYRNKTGTNTATDPSADDTNWELLSGLGNVLLANNQTFTGENSFSNITTFTSELRIKGAGAGYALLSFNGATSQTVTIPYNAGTSEVILGLGNQNIGGIKSFNNKVLLSAGSAASPSIAFSGEPSQDSGFWWGGTDGQFLIANNGVHSGTFGAGGNLTMVGNVTGYSDERLKKDWADIDSAEFITSLSNLMCGTYTRLDNDMRQAGVSAQGIQKFLPEVVMEDQNRILSVAYGNAALVACVQLAKEVEILKNKLSRLEE